MSFICMYDGNHVESIGFATFDYKAGRQQANHVESIGSFPITAVKQYNTVLLITYHTFKVRNTQLRILDKIYEDA